MADWSQLPEDILHQIIDRLTLLDSLRLGCVCPPWSAAVPPSRHRGRLPWLLLPSNPPPLNLDSPPDNAWLDTSLTFFSPLDHHLYPMHLPQLSERRLCGSSNGWLITIRKSGDIVLINPFSTKNRFTTLPSLMNVPGVYGYTYSEGHFFFNIADQPTGCPRNRAIPQNALLVRDTFIRKAIASSVPHLLVVCILGQFRKLMIHNQKFPKPARWSVIYDEKQYFDVTAYKGRFYAVDSHGSVTVLEGLDHKQEPFTSTVITGDDCEQDFHCLYLVESSGDLLKVVQYPRIKKQAQQTDASSNPPKNIAFKIFKLDFEQVKWVEVKDLGDRAIFLCSTHSSSVSTSDFPGCQGNCIYYADDGLEKYVTAGVHKYEMENGTISTIFSNEHSVILPSPIWYTSMQRQW